MKKISKYIIANRQLIFLFSLAVIIVAGLVSYRLGTLTGGLSDTEQHVASTPIGWHGIYHNPFYLLLSAIRSVDFYFLHHNSQALVRLPNTLLGALTIFSFAWLVRLWHGNRTAVFAGALFATSAWVLHVSRLASFDVLYLWSIPALLITYLELQRHNNKALVFYGSTLIWGLLMYIPGLIWLVLVSIFLARGSIAKGWKHFGRWWQRVAYVVAGVAWLPLLIIHLARDGQLRYWLGLPQHLAAPLTFLKDFAAVFVHLFIRGPEYPQLWLGKAPILDIFALSVCAIGIYFYAINNHAARSRLLGSFFLIGVILVALGGPVGISLLVPMLYLVAATGIAYLVREWLKVFPFNPLARGIGISLIVLAVALSCLYNLRAYFIAWPHNDTTQTVFRYHP